MRNSQHPTRGCIGWIHFYRGELPSSNLHLVVCVYILLIFANHFLQFQSEHATTETRFLCKQMLISRVGNLISPVILRYGYLTAS